MNLVHILLALGIIICGAAIVLDEADASPARLTALKSMDGWHERSNRKALQSRLGVNPSRTPWCGYAVAYAVRKAGGTPVKGYPRAVSWKRFGKGVKLSQARKGDVVVIKTKRGHHVSIFSYRKSGRVCLRGGNQSNRIKVTCYRASSVRSVRR